MLKKHAFISLYFSKYSRLINVTKFQKEIKTCNADDKTGYQTMQWREMAELGSCTEMIEPVPESYKKDIDLISLSARPMYSHVPNCRGAQLQGGLEK